MLKKNETMGNAIRLVCMAAIICLPSIAAAELLCGQPFEWLENEPGPVDIACVTGDVYVVNGTVNLLAGGQVTSLVGLGDCTINIYGGIIAGGDYGLNFLPTAFVTVYAASAQVDMDSITDNQWATHNDAQLLQITDRYVKNIGASTVWFNLLGTYLDQTPFIIPVALEANALLALSIPQALPEIYVQPALLAWDFGDVEVGKNATVLVQIFNYGNADLHVSSVSLVGDTAFTVTAGPAAPLVIAPSSSIGVDFEVTFAPTVAGSAVAVVQIVSDDADEPLVEVALSAVGIVVGIPPQQQIQNILTYFDAAAANGTLVGYGPGNSPSNRLKALRNMIVAASDLINAGAYELAMVQLDDIAKKTDGIARPQDFVVGGATPALNAMIKSLIADLAS